MYKYHRRALTLVHDTIEYILKEKIHVIYFEKKKRVLPYPVMGV
jgi:hypothetical protein